MFREVRISKIGKLDFKIWLRKLLKFEIRLRKLSNFEIQLPNFEIRLRKIPKFWFHTDELQPTIQTKDEFLELAHPCGIAILCYVHCSTCVA